MLQFLAGTSTLNIAWLTLLIIGTKAYNTPPLFFIGGFMLAATAFYGMTLRKEALQFVFLVGGLGILAAGLHGMTFWHIRQIIAFTASAIVWIYLYQQASYQDIFTLRNSQRLVWIYGIFMVLILAERYLLGSARLTYIVSSVFAIDPNWLVGYALDSTPPRLSYFSVEPSSAACAIAGVLMPYIVARAVAKPSVEAYVWLGASCVILYFAEGLTSQLFLLYTFGFLLSPRKATLFIPVVFAGILALALSFMQVLTDHNYLNFMLNQWFGGIYSRLDQGLTNGSYLSRIGTWFIAAREFANSPIYGQGIGGSGADMFNLAQSGLDVYFTADQAKMVDGGANVFNAQMVWRIPSELGIIGIMIFLWYGKKVLAIERRAMRNLAPIDYYAFVYSIGVMLVSFITNGEFALPTICAFVMLLGQTKRKLGDFVLPAAERAPAPGPQWSVAE